MSRPLLLVCTEVYPGPWVPASGLKGIVRAEGLAAGEDEVVIGIRDLLEEEEDTVITICEDLELKIDLTKTMVRATRTRSSGNEVSVWIE